MQRGVSNVIVGIRVCADDGNWQSPLLLFAAHCCHMGTAVKHPVPDRVKLSFVFLTSGHSYAQSWARSHSVDTDQALYQHAVVGVADPYHAAEKPQELVAVRCMFACMSDGGCCQTVMAAVYITAGLSRTPRHLRPLSCRVCHVTVRWNSLLYKFFIYFFCYFLSKLTNLCCIFERQLLLYPCSVLIILWYTGRLRVSGEDQDDQEKTEEAQSGRIYNTKDDAYLGGSRGGSSWQIRMASESGPVHPCFRSLATV